VLSKRSTHEACREIREYDDSDAHEAQRETYMSKVYHKTARISNTMSLSQFSATPPSYSPQYPHD
jgi:hypothetical protein